MPSSSSFLPSSSSEDIPSSSSESLPPSSSSLTESSLSSEITQPSSSSSQLSSLSSSSHSSVSSFLSSGSTSSLGDVWFLTQSAYVKNPFAKEYPPTDVILRSTFESAITSVAPQLDWITVEGLEEISDTPEGKDYKVSIKAATDQSTVDESGKLLESLSFDINLGGGTIENAATEIGSEKTFTYESKRVGSSLDWSGGIKAALVSSVTARVIDLFADVDSSVIASIEGSVSSWFDSEYFDASFETSFSQEVDLLSREEIASMELSAEGSASLKTPPAFDIISLLISGTVEGAFQPGLTIDPVFNGGLEFNLESDSDIYFRFLH